MGLCLSWAEPDGGLAVEDRPLLGVLMGPAGVARQEASRDHRDRLKRGDLLAPARRHLSA